MSSGLLSTFLVSEFDTSSSEHLEINDYLPQSLSGIISCV